MDVESSIAALEGQISQLNGDMSRLQDGFNQLRDSFNQLVSDNTEQLIEIKELLSNIPWYDIGVALGFLAGVLIVNIWAVTFNI